MKIKIVCARDSDGHYNAAAVSNKRASLKVLKIVDDGEYLTMVCEDNDLKEMTEELCLKLTEAEWTTYLQNFQQRGTFEITTIEI